MKKKIHIIVETFPQNTETFVTNHVVGLLNRGFDVSVFSLNKPLTDTFHPIVEQFNLLNRTYYKSTISNNKIIRVLDVIYKVLKKPFLIKLLLKSLNIKKYAARAYRFTLFYNALFLSNKEKPDIIHCHFGVIGYEMILLKELGLFKDIPVVVYFHGYDIKHINTNNYPHYYNKIFKFSSLICTNSLYSSKQLIKLGCSKEKIKCIPVSLDTDFFKKDINYNERSTFNVVTIGRLINLKAIDIGIRSIAKLINQGYSSLQYHIIGYGPLYMHLEELITKLNMQSHIHLRGSLTQDKIKETLLNSDAFILPGRYDQDGRAEAQGLVIQEAQAMELPVIISNVGGMPEGVIDEETGFIVEPEDIDSMTDKIKLLIENENLCKSMGRKGRKLAECKYSNTIITKAWQDTYQTLFEAEID